MDDTVVSVLELIRSEILGERSVARHILNLCTKRKYGQHLLCPLFCPGKRSRYVRIDWLGSIACLLKVYP
jgi:hypothetical protein